MEYILTVRVVDLSGAEVPDPLLVNADQIRYKTQYPGGLYGSASFRIAHDVRKRPTLIRGGHKVIIYDGWRIVYEGIIDGIEHLSDQASLVECVGFWGAYFERRGMNRRWVDNRTTEEAWYVNTANNGADLATVDRQDRVRIQTKNQQWNANDVFGLTYSMPTNETIGKTVMTVDFAEQAQNWSFRLRDLTTPTNIWNYSTAVSSGAQSVTLGTPRQSLELQLLSNSTQTPTDASLYFGGIRSISMYSSRSSTSATLGNVSAREIALDVAEELNSFVSVSLTDISTGLTLALNPFITNEQESFASILGRASAYGDASQNAIGYGLRRSQQATDNLPALFLEAYPALTSYDYELTMDGGQVDVRENTDDIYNWIAVKYVDMSGKRKTVTPDDDANLTDATSVSAYGRREKVLSVGNADQTDASNVGRRFLLRHKNPTWAISSPVRLTSIRAATGGEIPARQIEAGKRVKIVDLPDQPGAAGTLGATFLISGTDYDHDGGIVSVALGGVPDNLSVYMAQLAAGMNPFNSASQLGFINYAFG